MCHFLEAACCCQPPDQVLEIESHFYHRQALCAKAGYFTLFSSLDFGHRGLPQSRGKGEDSVRSHGLALSLIRYSATLIRFSPSFGFELGLNILHPSLFPVHSLRVGSFLRGSGCPAGPSCPSQYLAPGGGPGRSGGRWCSHRGSRAFPVAGMLEGARQTIFSDSITTLQGRCFLRSEVEGLSIAGSPGSRKSRI